MNIRKELLKEKIYTKEHALIISHYACLSKQNFKELMQCFLDTEYRVAQRAAWSVSWATKGNTELIKPFVKDLVAQLQRKDVPDAVIRNSVRILEAIEIPKIFHGDVMNACFAFIKTPSAPVAIKAFSLTTLFNLSKQYPEIKQELKLIIEDRWNFETSAFKSPGKKILERLSRTE